MTKYNRVAYKQQKLMFLSSGSWKFKIRMSSMPRSGISAGLHTPVASYGQRGTNLILDGPTLMAKLASQSLHLQVPSPLMVRISTYGF